MVVVSDHKGDEISSDPKEMGGNRGVGGLCLIVSQTDKGFTSPRL